VCVSPQVAQGIGYNLYTNFKIKLGLFQVKTKCTMIEMIGMSEEIFNSLAISYALWVQI